MTKKRRPNGYWTKQRCIESAKPHSTRQEWINAEGSAYDAAKRNGWYEACVAHMKRPASAKITHEEYVAQVAAIRPEYKVIGKYAGATTPIMHECDKGHQWLAYPTHIKRGTGCGKCANRGVEMYLEWLAENRPDITLVGEYKTKDTPTLHRCSKGHEWMAYPGHIKKGHGCDTCHRESMGHRPAGYWVFERCFESAQAYLTIAEWREAEHSAYNAAMRNGWLEQCTAHMERLQRKPYTDDELLSEAKKYRTRADWARESGSAYVTSVNRGKEFHDRACAHMERDSGHDNNAVYVWEIIDALGPTGIYKVGLTSWKLGDKRIKAVAGKHDLDYRLVALCKTSEGDARSFEDFIKDLGTPFTDVPDDFDGRTELRRFSPEAMNTVHQLLGVEEVLIETRPQQ